MNEQRLSYRSYLRLDQIPQLRPTSEFLVQVPYRS
jgi:hypothetical protein